MEDLDVPTKQCGTSYSVLLEPAASNVTEPVVDCSEVPTGSSSSSCEVLSQSSVSSILETFEKKTPFFKFRRVKALLNHLFTGAGRRRDGETTGSSGGSGSEWMFTEGQVIEVLTESLSKAENLLLLVDSENTVSRRTCDMFSVDSRSSTTSSKADDSSEEYETCSSNSSSGSNTHRPEDPKPQTVKKSSALERDSLKSVLLPWYLTITSLTI